MINENDFVLIDFVGRVKSSGKIFDLTKKEVAEKEGINNKELNFSPVLVIPASNYVLKAVASSLLGKEIGDKYTLEVKSEDAFGKFDPKLVKTIGLSIFRQNGVNPSVGDVVMLDNTLATVLSVSGGRVMVSFNNPLAGKDLVYEIDIVKKLEDTKEKCAAIFEHYVGKQPDSTDIGDNAVKMSYKEEIKPYTKDAISSDIKKYIGGDLKVEISSS
ncbi:MAG: peptidylprolyl isomerase [Candidatus Parvarchaeota archaeon]|nr:peptidylprolyl isomerase [Candidatus Parvarchaeota archaeon]